MKHPFFRRLWPFVAMLGGAIIVGVVVLYLVLADVTARANNIAKYRAEVAFRDTSVGTLAGLQKDAAVAAVYHDALGRLLPSQDAFIPFPRQIQVLGATYSVVAQASITGEPTPPSAAAVGFIPFSMTASGKSSDLMAFLKNFETQSSDFLAAVDSVNFRAGTSNDSQLSATGRVFFQ